MSLIDTIYRELFPPDGTIPVNKIDRELADHISSIREHIEAIEQRAVSIPTPIQEPVRVELKPKKTLAKPEYDESDKKIVELRDGEGKPSWTEIKNLLNDPRSPKTLRDRYSAYKRRTQSNDAPLISDIDKYILKLHNEGSVDLEIAIAVSRNYGKPLSASYIARRIREIKHLMGAD